MAPFLKGLSLIKGGGLKEKEVVHGICQRPSVKNTAMCWIEELPKVVSLQHSAL